jgi:predicted MarR family transcription regulator
MTKTWKERILNAATKEETINRQTLRKRFRIPATEMNNEDFNNTIGRSTRALRADGLLKRTERGTYQITRKGEKQLAYYQA